MVPAAATQKARSQSFILLTQLAVRPQYAPDSLGLVPRFRSSWCRNLKSAALARSRRHRGRRRPFDRDVATATGSAHASRVARRWLGRGELADGGVLDE